jgi:hypothetical protein
VQQIQAFKKRNFCGGPGGGGVGKGGAKKGLKSPLYEEKEKLGIAIFRQYCFSISPKYSTIPNFLKTFLLTIDYYCYYYFSNFLILQLVSLASIYLKMDLALNGDKFLKTYLNI